MLTHIVYYFSREMSESFLNFIPVFEKQKDLICDVPVLQDIQTCSDLPIG